MSKVFELFLWFLSLLGLYIYTENGVRTCISRNRWILYSSFTLINPIYYGDRVSGLFLFSSKIFRVRNVVFIGQNLDKESMTEALDDCLLTNEDILKGKAHWATFTDPFPAWDQIQ